MQLESHKPITTSEVITLGASRVRISGHLELLHTARGVRPLRLPTEAWANFPPPAAPTLRAVVSRPSGVRLCLQTSSSDIRLLVHCTQFQLEDMPGQVNSFVATMDGEEVATAETPVNSIESLSFSGGLMGENQVGDEVSAVDLTGLPRGDKTIEIWLPQMVTVDLVGIEAAAPIEPATPGDRPVWVHHGSSISHCAEADKPTSTWPVVAARRAGLDVVNLGYAGQCMLDPFVADAVARIPAALISLKIGVNIVSSRSMNQRTFIPAVHGFIDRIRAGLHEHTPLILVSPIFWPGNEGKPGPVDFEEADGGELRFILGGDTSEVTDGALSLEVVRRELNHVVESRAERGEPIRYLDGLSLYGPDDVSRYPLPDGLHPDALLYEEMGRRFAALVLDASTSVSTRAMTAE